MVGNDIPFPFYFLKENCVVPAQISDLSFQIPFTDDKIIFRGKPFQTDQHEKQFPHLQRVTIILLVIIQGIVIAVADPWFQALTWSPICFLIDCSSAD